MLNSYEKLHKSRAANLMDQCGLLNGCNGAKLEDMEYLGKWCSKDLAKLNHKNKDHISSYWTLPSIETCEKGQRSNFYVRPSFQNNLLILT